MTYFSPNFLKQHNILDWGVVYESIPETYDYYKEWAESEDSLPLNYLRDERKEYRSDLKNTFPEFKSALVFLFSYRQAAYENLNLTDTNGLKFSHYVWGFEGQDYHNVLKKKFVLIKSELEKSIGPFKSLEVVDTAPVLDRDLAYSAGLGWFGKNSMLIHPEYGSYFIIGSLLIDKEVSVPFKAVETDHCGTCRDCIEACPTDAINANRTLIADKCISTFTIEKFKECDPPDGMDASQSEVFGCDICQDVCPWNKKVIKGLSLKEDFWEKPEERKKLYRNLLKTPLKSLIESLSFMSGREFKRTYIKTPLARTGRVGLLKNLKWRLKS